MKEPSDLRLTFRARYFVAFLGLLAIEVFIAFCVRDGFVRPFVGDAIVVVLLYAFIQSFTRTPTGPTTVAIFAFACLVETGQYFHLVRRLGLQNSEVARIVIGTEAHWEDVIAYAVGCALIWLFEICSLESQR